MGIGWQEKLDQLEKRRAILQKEAEAFDREILEIILDAINSLGATEPEALRLKQAELQTRIANLRKRAQSNFRKREALLRVGEMTIEQARKELGFVQS
jgi:prefoldin subunit 5